MKNGFNNTLDFNKTAIVELNNQQMGDVDSGITPALASSTFCLQVGAAVSSNFCASVALGAATYAITQL